MKGTHEDTNSEDYKSCDIGPRVRLPCIFALGEAVSPPPDGGYPGVQYGRGAKRPFESHHRHGLCNAAVGYVFAFCKAPQKAVSILVLALERCDLNTGDNNTATGAAALLLNTTGQRNTADGTAALVNNSTGEDNTAVGAFALNSNTASSEYSHRVKCAS